MNVSIIENNHVVKKVKAGKKFLSLSTVVNTQDIVIVMADGYTFFEGSPETLTDGCNFRKCEEVEGISTGEIRIMRDMFSTFTEITDITTFLKEYPYISKEEFVRSVGNLLRSVRNHNKINEQQEMLLFDVFSGNKTKKQLFESGSCTYEELEQARSQVISELKWCYGFNRESVVNRIYSFSSGDIEFFYSTSSYLKKNGLEKVFLTELLNKIINSKSILKHEQKMIFADLFEKFCNEVTLMRNEKQQLIELFGIFYSEYHRQIKAIYENCAKELIEAERTGVNDVLLYCLEKGYSKHRLLSALQKCGIRFKKGSIKDFVKNYDEYFSYDRYNVKNPSVIYVFTGPSSSGKTTIFKEVLPKIPCLCRTVSDTTRKPRDNERDKIDYNFITTECFNSKRSSGQYVEYTYYDGHFYGTTIESIEANCCKAVAMVVDLNGAKKISELFENVVTIFISPPSLEELKKRIILRGDNTEEEIEWRLKKAETEMQEKDNFDYVIVNDVLEDAVKKVCDIILPRKPDCM